MFLETTLIISIIGCIIFTFFLVIKTIMDERKRKNIREIRTEKFYRQILQGICDSDMSIKVKIFKIINLHSSSTFKNKDELTWEYLLEYLDKDKIMVDEL